MNDRGVIVGGPAQWGWPVLQRLRWPRLIEAMGPLPHRLSGRPPSPRFVEDWLAASIPATEPVQAPAAWTAWWQAADEAGGRAAVATLAEAWGAPAVVHHVARSLPPSAAMHWANSLAIRDGFEFSGGAEAYVNVGVNGIDGTLSTALGEAWAATDRPVCLLTGDLAFLHDQGALLAARDIPGRVTAVVVDNCGGAIFRTPDIAPQAPAAGWERYLVTPHRTDLVAMCAAHGVPAVRVDRMSALLDATASDLERPGLGVIVADVRGCDDDGLRRQVRAAARAAIDALGPPCA